MRNKKGFTFIEILIALTIFSIIAVSVYSVFRTGVTLWQRTSPLIQANQSARFFFNTISSDLKNSIAYSKADTKAPAASLRKTVNFEGKPQEISFMTLIESSGPGAATHTELARVTYSFDRTKKTVVRSVATAAEGLNEDHAKAADILEGVDGKYFGFEYCYRLGASPTDYDYEWEDTWADEDRDKGKIPRGIKVKALGYSKTIFIPTGKLGGKDET